MTKRIYLDNAATTPVRSEALQAMLPYFTHCAYNAGSLHAEGRAARKALDDARACVAQCIGAKHTDVLFTGSGSESDNLALIGVARALRERGRHIVASAIEHHAVLHALDALGDEGFEITLLDVDERGVLQPQTFESALRPDTILASVMYVNNELGTVQPLSRLAALARRNGTFFHTDAVQAAAYLPVDVRELGVDALSLAAHKLHGPKGVGALYIAHSSPLLPIVHGGSQEFAKRAGTENVAGIVGFARALELAVAERAATAEKVQGLRDRFEARIQAGIADVRVNGAGAPRSPHISNLSFLGVSSEQLLVRLDLDGVAASAGSACASGSIEPSHVIAALDLPEPWTRGVIRFSLDRDTTQADLDRAAQVLERSVEDLRAIAAAPLGSGGAF